MIKQEISELKKLLTQNHCSITRICGCYVDGEKNKKLTFCQPFLALPDEEMFKYFEILRKNYSGTLGKNLLNLEFPLDAEFKDGAQEFLLRLRDSKLKDEELLDAYYDKIIENYEYTGNYLILIVHDVYDVPGRTKDGLDMEDASTDIYEYILSCICPVALSKPGLSYFPEENAFQNRIRDWVVGMPETGFLFPAFDDRGSNIHSLLYYSKNAEALKDSFVSQLFHCTLPLSAGSQKDTFHALIEETLGEECKLEAVKAIHEKLSEMVEEHKEDTEPLTLSQNEMKTLFAGSGVSNEKMEEFDKHFEETAGQSVSLLADNLINTRSFEVKTPDVVIKVKPDRTDLVDNRIIDGRSCLVIRLDGIVEVNGISLQNDSE